MSYRPLASNYATSIEVLQGRSGVSGARTSQGQSNVRHRLATLSHEPMRVSFRMRLLLALLLGNAAANPLISLASKAKALVNFKNAAGATLVAPVLGGLNSLREAASDAEDHRQGVKEALRVKAQNTAEYVVWLHVNKAERESTVCTHEEFCKMMASAKPMMMKKMKRRGRLARWFSSTPPPELIEIFVREEIARVLSKASITLQDPEGEACAAWTKENFKIKTKKPWCFAWWPRKITLPCTVCEPEASTGTCKNNQGKGKVIKFLGAVVSIAVGVALLPFK